MKNELYHYGVSGQKWGVRRYQNGDGSYTSEGKKRYKKKSSSSKSLWLYAGLISLRSRVSLTVLLRWVNALFRI